VQLTALISNISRYTYPDSISIRSWTPLIGIISISIIFTPLSSHLLYSHHFSYSEYLWLPIARFAIMSKSFEDPEAGRPDSKEVGEKLGQSLSPTESVLGYTGISIDPKAERSLVWKFDLRILPCLAAMYLFNSLDKSNLGNAKTAGLEKTLHMHGNQYSLILSIFFIPYVLTAPFLGILGKKLGPNKVLPCMMLSFGFCTVMVVVVQNFAGLLAIRWFLGMSESAFFPLVIYYLTTYAPIHLFPHPVTNAF
jgi:hypothetical protein